MGVEHDDIVSIVSYNHIDFGPCVWASHRVGAIVSTISPTYSSSELVVQLRLVRPSLLIVHADCLPLVLASFTQFPQERMIVIEAPTSTGTKVKYRSLQSVMHEGSRMPPAVERTLAEDEAKTAIAFLAPSSGTTGFPKAVAITHYNVINMITQEAAFNRLNEPYTFWSQQRFRAGDVCGGCEYSCLHFMLYAGMTLVLARKFHFESFLSFPPQVVLLCKHPATRHYNLSCVRYCVVAAAPLSATLTEELLSVLPNIELGQAYGNLYYPVNQRIGTLGSGGQLLPGTSAKIVKEDGTLANYGEAGELYIQGGQVALGYFGNPKETARTFVDGWLRTGDQAMFKDKDIFILERVKELIKVKAFQVAPAELEGHLLTHTCIADAAVVGVPDDFAGELPFAFVVLKAEAGRCAKTDPSFAEKVKTSIYHHIAKSLSAHKRLDGGIAFIDEIPRNASGKILRRGLRGQSSKYLRPETGRARL
ncbi:hypothetical protein CPB85DRAFT_1312678 [Mucidula mucida]|nr:hypothetical protein CPB85DRAFT_1312678 [Mucidula mucida]